MLTRLEHIRRQQMQIGDEPLTAETDAGADTYIAIFEETTDDLLSRYAWFWSTVTRRLTRLSDTPAAHWKYYYQLPAEMIGAPRAVYASAELRQPTTAFELTENRLATDHEEIWLRFSKRVPVNLWPGYFVKLHGVVMQSQLALSVREDHPMFARLQEVAFGPPHMMGDGGLMGQAVAADTQAKPSPVVADGVHPLLSARSGSTGRWSL